MPAPLKVVHDTDPKQDIWDEVGRYIEQIEPLGDRVLLVMYERTKQKGDVRTAGGIIVPETKNGSAVEDKWQGKVGMVVKMGPLAFTEDETHKWGGVVPKVGDWVMISVGNSYSFDLPGDRRAREVRDVYVENIVRSMDIVY